MGGKHDGFINNILSYISNESFIHQRNNVKHTREKKKKKKSEKQNRDKLNKS